MLLWRKRMVKLEHWVVKFRSTKRDLGYLQLNYPKWVRSSMNLKEDQEILHNNLNLISNDFKNCYQKIITLLSKFDLHKKILGCRLAKLVNFKTNSKWFAIKMNSLSVAFNNSMFFSKNIRVRLKIKQPFLPSNARG